MAPRHALIIVALLAAGCGGGDATGPGASTPIASLGLSATSDTLLVRESVAVSVRAVDDSGTILTGRPITWTSSDSTVLSVSRGGVVTALRAGTATLQASSGDAVASRTLTVRALRFASVSTGRYVTCGLEGTGDLWCWGNVPATGFGNGDAKPFPSPVPRRAAIGHRFASLAFSPWRAFVCGVELGGTVSCWGSNDSGQLGDGTTTPHYAPVTVGGLTSVTAVAVGLTHACALTSSGSVYCWGDNSAGQLGDGTLKNIRTTPVRVQGLTGATAVTAGNESSCAISAGGTMCWGSDWYGELGHDTTYDRLLPARAAATAGSSPVYSVMTANAYHVCGLTSGSAFCWGTFDTGVFDGYDIFDAFPTPQAAGHQFARLADGGRLQCGLEAGGTAWCWVFGHAPLQYPSTNPLIDVAVGFDIACALDASGATSCWDPRNAPDNPPVAVSNAPAFVHLAAGDDLSSRTCGITAAGAVWCWVNWTTGVPASLASGGTVFSSIWSGAGPVCAITGGGDAWCVTQFGDLAAKAIGYSLVEVTTGADHICGRTAAGTALCWGASNPRGQLGDGTRVAHASPAPVSGGLVFTSLAAGWDHSCGATAAGALYCWGAGITGVFGDGGPFIPLPQPVSGSPSFTQLASGGIHTCGLAGGGSLACWPQRTTIPTAAPLTQITAGDDYACGLDATGSATCWTPTSGRWPITTPGTAVRFATIAAGGQTTCGITAAGATWCWGDNTNGILGSPDAQGLSSSAVPLKVYGSE